MIDFHCHLDLYQNPAAIRDECDKRGMYVLSVTTTPSAWNQTSALSSGRKRIRTGLGLHPQIAHERHNELTLFDELLPNARYVGEIGLDGGKEFRPHWQTQTKAFEHILARCSEEGGRIMSIHSRRASRAVLDCLEAHPGAGPAVLHWFSGSLRELDRAVRLGCWFSVGPAMLVGESGQALVARMPRDRVLTESDGPFAQLNGETVMPWHVASAVTELGRIWSLSPEEAGAVVQENLRRLVSCE